MIILKLISVLIFMENVNGMLDQQQLWQPDNGQSREDWFRMNGMSEQEFYEVEAKKKELNALMCERDTNCVSEILEYQSNQEMPVSSSLTVPTCKVLLTSSQLTEIINGLKKEVQSTTESHLLGKRKKRYMLDLKIDISFKWNLPIIYKFDGNHTESDRIQIRDAINHVMASTCVTMREIPTEEPCSTNHILFVQGDGCSSYVGKQSFFPQMISIGEGCTSIGIVAHEINHALGAQHEHQRPDRNNTIKLMLNSVNPSVFFNFYLDPKGDISQSPYDFNSVMHYEPKAFSMNSSNVIETLDSLYQNNIGQRQELSFYDAKIINHHYCSEVCSSKLASPCQNDGYQDPLNCQACRCPDGLDGQFCETIAPPKNAICGDTIILNNSFSSQSIKSPGYDDPGYYNVSQECTWLIKTEPGYFINLQFVESFSIYILGDSCYHWVEAKYKANKSLNGPRFCGYTVPTASIISEGNEMLVIFKSNSSIDYEFKGFFVNVSLQTTTTKPTITTEVTVTKIITTNQMISSLSTSYFMKSNASIKSTTLIAMPLASTIVKTSTPFILTTNTTNVLKKSNLTTTFATSQNSYPITTADVVERSTFKANQTTTPFESPNNMTLIIALSIVSGLSIASLIAIAIGLFIKRLQEKKSIIKSPINLYAASPVYLFQPPHACNHDQSFRQN